MGPIVIACYRPRRGQEARLRKLIEGQMPALRSEGLATGRARLVVKSADGTCVEVLEWSSREAIAAAHDNAPVQAMGAEFEQVCDYVTYSDLPEARRLFAEFVPVDELSGA